MSETQVTVVPPQQGPATPQALPVVRGQGESLPPDQLQQLICGLYLTGYQGFELKEVADIIEESDFNIYGLTSDDILKYLQGCKGSEQGLQGANELGLNPDVGGTLPLDPLVPPLELARVVPGERADNQLNNLLPRMLPQLRDARTLFDNHDTPLLVLLQGLDITNVEPRETELNEFSPPEPGAPGPGAPGALGITFQDFLRSTVNDKSLNDNNIALLIIIVAASIIIRKGNEGLRKEFLGKLKKLTSFDFNGGSASFTREWEEREVSNNEAVWGEDESATIYLDNVFLKILGDNVPMEAREFIAIHSHSPESVKNFTLRAAMLNLIYKTDFHKMMNMRSFMSEAKKELNMYTAELQKFNSNLQEYYYMLSKDPQAFPHGYLTYNTPKRWKFEPGQQFAGEPLPLNTGIQGVTENLLHTHRQLHPGNNNVGFYPIPTGENRSAQVKYDEVYQRVVMTYNRYVQNHTYLLTGEMLLLLGELRELLERNDHNSRELTDWERAPSISRALMAINVAISVAQPFMQAVQGGQAAAERYEYFKNLNDKLDKKEDTYKTLFEDAVNRAMARKALRDQKAEENTAGAQDAIVKTRLERQQHFNAENRAKARGDVRTQQANQYTAGSQTIIDNDLNIRAYQADFLTNQDPSINNLRSALADNTASAKESIGLLDGNRNARCGIISNFAQCEGGVWGVNRESLRGAAEHTLNEAIKNSGEAIERLMGFRENLASKLYKGALEDNDFKELHDLKQDATNKVNEAARVANVLKTFDFQHANSLDEAKSILNTMSDQQANSAQRQQQAFETFNTATNTQKLVNVGVGGAVGTLAVASAVAATGGQVTYVALNAGSVVNNFALNAFQSTSLLMAPNAVAAAGEGGFAVAQASINAGVAAEALSVVMPVAEVAGVLKFGAGLTAAAVGATYLTRLVEPNPQGNATGPQVPLVPQVPPPPKAVPNNPSRIRESKGGYSRKNKRRVTRRKIVNKYSRKNRKPLTKRNMVGGVNKQGLTKTGEIIFNFITQYNKLPKESKLTCMYLGMLELVALTSISPSSKVLIKNPVPVSNPFNNTKLKKKTSIKLSNNSRKISNNLLPKFTNVGPEIMGNG